MSFVAAAPVRAGRTAKSIGVSVGMRRSADNDPNKVGRLTVNVYPETARKLGFKKGDAVALFYGRGEDAGKAMLRKATADDAYTLTLQAIGKDEEGATLNVTTSALPRDPDFVGPRQVEDVKFQIAEGSLIFTLPNWII